MYVWLFATVMVACQQVTPDGDPLQPVVIDAEEPTEDAVDEPEDASDEEVFRISSEELAEIANVDGPTEAPSEKVTQEEVANSNPVETKSETPKVEAVSPAAPVGPGSSGWGDVIGKAWPVRLVTTVPNATPPRAILGLPDGREVVVNPGSMVPDMGLVVVAIAPDSAELARIAPAGDHATIETMTLRAQY